MTVLSLVKRYRESLLVLVLLVYPLGTFLSAGHRGRPTHVIDRIVLSIAAPLQGALTWAFEGVLNGVKGYVAILGVRDRNAVLEVENAKLKSELLALQEMSTENKRLKRLFDYSESTPPKEILARVIGVNPSSNILSLRVNRGEADGLQPAMPVVTAEGVVGQIRRVVGKTSDVVLLTDRSSKVAIVNQRSRVRGTAAGTGNSKSLSLQNVLKSDDVVEGDWFITSGTDGVFPRGLRVGQVGKVERKVNSMFIEARINPAVSLGYLEELLIFPMSLADASEEEAAR